MLVAILTGLLRLTRLLKYHIAVEVVGRLVDGWVRAHGQGDGRTAEAVVCLLVDAMLPAGSPSAPIALLKGVPAMTACLAREGSCCI